MPKAGKITHKLHTAAIKLNKCTDYAKVCYYSDKMHKLKQRAIATLHAECKSGPTVHWLCLYSALVLYGVPVQDIDFSKPQQFQLAEPEAPKSEKAIDVDDEFGNFLDDAADGTIVWVEVTPITNVMGYDQVLRDPDNAPLPVLRKPVKEKKYRTPRLNQRQLAAAQQDAHNQVLAQRAIDPLYTDSELSF